MLAVNFHVAPFALECLLRRDQVRERLGAKFAVGGRAVPDRFEDVPVEHYLHDGCGQRQLWLVRRALACERALKRQRLRVLVGARLNLDAIEREQHLRDVLTLGVDRILLRGRPHVVDALELQGELEVLLFMVLKEEQRSPSYLAVQPAPAAPLQALSVRDLDPTCSNANTLSWPVIDVQ